jgi:hypothetical protein
MSTVMPSPALNMPALSSHLEVALYRARCWLCNAVERRARFIPPANMRPDQVARHQEKLDADIDLARARVSGLEAEAAAHEANFGGL